MVVIPISYEKNKKSKVKPLFMDRKVLEVNIDEISVNPYQPRKKILQEELNDLAQSIQSVGLIQPPIVHFLEDQGKYELISGERRFRAAQLAGLKTIPVIVSQTSRDYSAEAALIENIQRVDLNPLEIAKALKRLMTEFDFQQEELAQRIGKKRSTIANYLRLLSLPRVMQESLSSGKITMGHAKVILSMEDFEKQHALYEQIILKDLSVREAEALAQKVDKPLVRNLAKISIQNCFLQDLQDKIRVRLGTKVQIDGTGQKGTISIDYYNLDDLDRILELIGVPSKEI